MNHSFDAVDEKIAETEFFLRKLVEAGSDMFAFRCYLSAFLSAARTCTLGLQQFKEVIPGFGAWYEPHRDRLKASEPAKFLLETRNEPVHGGPSPIAGRYSHKGISEYRFSPSQAGYTPAEDIVTVCRDHFAVLLEIVYDCYVQLGIHVDPQQYYSKEHFATMGRTIDDAELEVCGWICETLIDEGFDEDARWNELRGHLPECEINHLFFSYLGKTTPEPPMPEEYDDFAYTPEEKGWIHPPAGFSSPGEFQRYYAQRTATTTPVNGMG